MAVEILLWVGVFAVSLAALLKASDWFVDAAEKVGLALGIPSYIIGVTIVAVGTSLPELATSIAAVMNGVSEVVVGNAVGSNIANICLVLATIAIIGKKVKLNFDIIVVDLPLLIGSAFLLYFMLQPDNTGVARVTMLEAFLLMGGLILFLAYSFSSDDEDGGKKKVREKVHFKTIAILVGSAALIYLGATYSIEAIIKLSELMNIGAENLALSLVAVGTSLPEVIVSISATRKGNAEIAVGNVLGSNVFNTFAVMGIPAFFGDLAIPQGILDFSLPFMIGATILFFFMMISKSISKWEGWMLGIFYIYFLTSLFV